MSEPSLELQKAIRTRLVGTSAVTSLVPATSIVDRNGRPPTVPSILIGEGQTVPDGDIARKRHQVFTDVHVWTEEIGLVSCKQIVGAVRAALADTVWNVTGLQVADIHISSSRFMRDPDGAHSHSVVSITASVLELP